MCNINVIMRVSVLPARRQKERGTVHMSEKDYILAMYDIRGKQDYIYKSSKIKEIVGGSYIIRDCFDDCLFPAAEKVSEKGIFSYRRNSQQDEPEEFTPENFESRLEKGYVGEVVYDGGGNFFVLYRDAEVYREVNRRFYRELLDMTYSLRVLTTCIGEINFDNYPQDRGRLYAEHHRREQRESMINPVNTLPVVQTDYRTSLPLAELQHIGNRDEKVSYESKKKYVKYEEMSRERTNREIQIQLEGSDKLDNLITKKGEESLLAVIYIDGNSMGAQVERCLNGVDKSYSACVKALRQFSEEIQTHYIDKRIADVDALLEKRANGRRRFVVYAGDEVTFICNARNAYDVAREYLTRLAEESPQGAPRTSCAGIAVFHSHAPFREAYRIAEECCESGKKLMKAEGITNASLIDFHYCQGAFGTSLEEIRKEEETENSSRPWFIKYYDGSGQAAGREGLIKEKYISDDIVQKMKDMLNKAGRSNIKNLALSARKSAADFKSELERICAHQLEKHLDFTLGGLLDDEMQRKLIYDMVIVYDLWFDEEKNRTAEKEDA